MRPRRGIPSRLLSGLYVFFAEALVVVASILFALSVAAVVLAIR